MTAARRPSPQSKPAAQKQGTLARLRTESARLRPEQQITPYVIDDVDPPISISLPEDGNTQLELVELFGNTGAFQVQDARRVLRLVCGDQYDRVMEVFGREHITVMLAFVEDMGRHFAEQVDQAEKAAAAQTKPSVARRKARAG